MGVMGDWLCGSPCHTVQDSRDCVSTVPNHDNDGNTNINMNKQLDNPSKIPETGDMLQPFSNSNAVAFTLAGIGSILEILKKEQKKE